MARRRQQQACTNQQGRDGSCDRPPSSGLWPTRQVRTALRDPAPPPAVSWHSAASEARSLRHMAPAIARRRAPGETRSSDWPATLRTAAEIGVTDVPVLAALGRSILRVVRPLAAGNIVVCRTRTSSPGPMPAVAYRSRLPRPTSLHSESMAVFVAASREIGINDARRRAQLCYRQAPGAIPPLLGSGKHAPMGPTVAPPMRTAPQRAGDWNSGKDGGEGRADKPRHA